MIGTPVDQPHPEMPARGLSYYPERFVSLSREVRRTPHCSLLLSLPRCEGLSPHHDSLIFGSFLPSSVSVSLDENLPGSCGLCDKVIPICALVYLCAP